MQSWGQLTLISMEKVSKIQLSPAYKICRKCPLNFQIPHLNTKGTCRLANCNHTTNINNLSLLAASPHPHHIHAELNEEIICLPSEKKARWCRGSHPILSRLQQVKIKDGIPPWKRHTTLLDVVLILYSLSHYILLIYYRILSPMSPHQLAETQRPWQR